MDAVNPCPPDWLDNEDNALLRGDAIGDTAYTHRWILKCLFTITENLPKYVEQTTTTNQTNGKSDIENGSGDHSNNASNDGSQSDDKNIDESTESKFVELDTEVEDAACQLWDMTVERDVSLHLLSMEEIDVLQLATIVIDESLAPRLTEVIVGVVANLCCQEEGCEKVLKKENLRADGSLLSILHLLGSTSDVPTLCEVMRLIRLLLWHRINRSPKSNWASCPLLKLLCQDCYRDAISFLINNALSDSLITNLLELLSSFLFISLPETGLSIASMYSQKDTVNGLIDILVRKSSLPQHQVTEEQEKIVHLAVMCLYAFIDTPGARLIQSSASASDSKLENTLLLYIEREVKVESPEELLGDIGEHLTRVIGLSQLLIPFIKQPSLILNVGKLIALISGEALQYSVNKSNLEEVKGSGTQSSWDEICTGSDNLEKERSRRRRSSEKERKKVEYKSQYSNPSSEEFGWLSPPPVSMLLDSSANSSIDMTSVAPSDAQSITLSNPEAPQPSGEQKTQTKSSSSKIKPDLIKELEELKELLEDYSYHLLAYWWSDPTDIDREKRIKTQNVIIDVLDQCHAHEVLFILKAVRYRDPTLVPKLQEQIIDSGYHERLVALLAHMYQ